MEALKHLSTDKASTQHGYEYVHLLSKRKTVTVLAARETLTGRDVAIKSNKNRKAALLELRRHQRVSGLPYILELYNAYDDPSGNVHLGTAHPFFFFLFV